MRILTDHPDTARRICPHEMNFKSVSGKACMHLPDLLIDSYFPEENIFRFDSDGPGLFDYLFIRDRVSFSQFDLLLEIARQDKNQAVNIACMAGNGPLFHGFHNRQWVGLEGNLHLSILLSPRQEINNAQQAFLILAANAVVNTLNSLENLKRSASIKWVNDILIDGAKVGGVLAQTQMQGNRLDKVVLGIGLNIERCPDNLTDPVVGRATAVNQHLKGRHVYGVADIAWPLLKEIGRLYDNVRRNRFEELFKDYVAHSRLIGRDITVYSDPREGPAQKIISGKVIAINKKLELILAGEEEPVRKGRISINEI